MPRRKKQRDPFYDREKEKYENPIPSREFIIEYLRSQARPMRRAEIIEALGLTSETDQEAIRRRLRAMERDGQIIFTRRGGYGLVDKMNLVRGQVIGHKDGYGFVIPDEEGKDLFLNAQQMRLVFDGDRVLVRVINVDRKGRREGEIVEVLQRNTNKLIGRFFIEKGIGFVTPENQRISQDIIIHPDEQANAKNGQYVTVEIISPPTFRSQAVARVVEIVGEHMAPGMEIDVAIRAYALPYQWNAKVAEEIHSYSEEVSEKDKKNRVDLRDKNFVTIDGEDAKDFDDAVFCEKKSQGGWVLYVAIADVSFYVKPNTALDEEAKSRGNSVYFPGRVIPMLPEILSNGLCSLKPNCDRLALVCEMKISAKGKLTDYKFYEAVIHSKARMTYTNVAAILVQKHKARRNQYKDILHDLESLYDLYKHLIKKRHERGALDFDTVETKIVFDANRKIEEIVPVVRNDAHKLIEECMLMANVATAKFLEKNDIPGLYRVHEGPNPDRLIDLHSFLGELGLHLKGSNKPKPKDYANLLREIADRKDAHLIQTVLLRSLSQAVYSPDNFGHFGLAFDAYTHFTSPIRRYPDLLVHRLIRFNIQKQKTKFLFDHETLVKLGEHCSITERRADEATRDVTGWLKCEYIQDRVGEEFDGIITGVAAFGIFVELKDIYVEGMVHVTALPNDYYHYDPVKHRLLGERTSKSFRLADSVRVKVVRVDLDNRQIDFELVVKAKRKKGKK